eukprot:1161447-Pelagomonas_calceolata.AAC.6
MQGKGAAAKGKPLPPRPLIKPGKGGRGEVPEEQPKLERGCLQAVLPLKANVACRNWLRNGKPRCGSHLSLNQCLL